MKEEKNREESDSSSDETALRTAPIALVDALSPMKGASFES